MKRKGNETKIRVLALYNILKDGKQLKRVQIEKILEKEYEIDAPDRKTFADDINVLTMFLPVGAIRRGSETYYGIDSEVAK